MSDDSTPRRRPVVWARLFLEILLVAAIAAVVYFEYVRQTAPKHLRLALVTWTQDPFWQPMLRGARDYAEKSNIDLTIVQSKPSVDEQTQDIRQVLGSGLDGIAISPNDAGAEHEILSDAARQVPMVTFDTDAPDCGRKRFVGIDNYAAGRVCAGEMVDALPEGGPILISVGSVTQQHGRDRRQGVIDELLGRGFNRDRAPDAIDANLKGPKFSVVYTATDGGVPENAVGAIAAGLRAHPEVKGIIGLFSYSAPAALAAVKQVGRTEPIAIVGFDASDETQEALVAGTIHSSVLQDSYRAGYETMEVLANEARGVPPGPAELSPMLYVGIDVLTTDNLDQLRSAGKITAPSGSATTRPDASS
jgi:ribose transport system substrate-binding protein